MKGNYIHLVELVKHGCSSQGNGYSDTFAETIKYLADKYGLSYSKDGYSRDDAVLDRLEAIMNWYQKQLPADMKQKLMKNYGWTSEFIETEGIGYGAKCPSAVMSEFFSDDELLETGLFNKRRNGKGVFHIYQDRIVFPYKIRGRVRYSIGRATDNTKWTLSGKCPKYYKQYVRSEQKQKHLYVSEAIKNQIIYCNKDREDIFISEGIADYFSLKMNNVNSVSAVTVQFKKEEYQSVVDYCKQFKNIYIANDNDDNEAGQKGSIRICEMLLTDGLNPRIITLPKSATMTKIDVAEFVRDNGIDAFLDLRKESRSYIDFLISEIDPNIDKTQLFPALEKVMTLLAKLPEEQVEIYIKEKIRKHFKLSSYPTILTQLKKKIAEMNQEISIKEKKSESSIDKIFENINPQLKTISSGQDFVDGVLYYTVTTPKMIKDKDGNQMMIHQPYIVTSERKFYEVEGGQFVTPEIILKNKLPNTFRADNWTITGSLYSVDRYLKGECKVPPDEVFERIQYFFDRHMVFPYEGLGEHLTIAVMASYVAMCFHSIGYIHLNAEKQSGKTTGMEMMNELGFNSCMNSSISDAAVFRIIERNRPLLCIDEAENLNPSAKQRESGMPNERLELYKSGYKKNGKATRCEGQNNTPVEFSNYCMKVFASIKQLDSTLADRTIVHHLKRISGDRKIPEWVPDRTREAFDEIVDMLYIFGMQYANEIYDVYKNLDNYQESLDKYRITHRNREVWGPYLCIAIVIDRYKPELRMFEKMLKVALYTIEDKESFNKESKNLNILERLYLWTKRVRNNDISDLSSVKREGDLFLVKGIREDFIKNDLKEGEDSDDYDYVKYSHIKILLRKYHVINKDSEVRNTYVEGTKGIALILEKEKMLEALKIYKNGDCCEEVLVDLAADDADIEKDDID